jgi:hypothetical protein
MNLYQIMLEHYAPKDSEKGIFTYLVANSDEEVYEWIASEKELSDGRQVFNSWKYKDEEDTFENYDDDYNVIGEETFKERIIRLKGDMNDEDAELDDLYYGRTLLGWEIVKFSITDIEIAVLKGLGISVETV